MDHFKLVSEYAPTGDQPRAIEELVVVFAQAGEYTGINGIKEISGMVYERLN